MWSAFAARSSRRPANAPTCWRRLNSTSCWPMASSGVSRASCPIRDTITSSSWMAVNSNCSRLCSRRLPSTAGGTNFSKRVRPHGDTLRCRPIRTAGGSTSRMPLAREPPCRGAPGRTPGAGSCSRKPAAYGASSGWAACGCHERGSQAEPCDETLVRETMADTSNADFAADLIGTHLVVGITHVDHAGNAVSHEQFHGQVNRASVAEGVVLVDSAGKEHWVPLDREAFRPADPGAYTLKSTGETLVDPEWLSTWTVHPPDHH